MSEGLLRAGVLTVSDRASAGTYIDETGPEIVAAILNWHSDAAIATEIIPDERALIESTLFAWCDEEGLDLIITNGGTGLSSRDMTPEATATVVEREIPGLAELMRSRGMQHTPMAALARQVVGQRGTTLIVNVPGSVRAATESFAAIVGVLDHALEMIQS